MTRSPQFGRRGLAASLVAASALAFAACGGSSSSSSDGAAKAEGAGSAVAAKATGPLVIADAAVTNSLDPDGPSGTFVGNIVAVENAYEALTDYQPSPNPEDMGGGQFIDTTKVAPALATEWEGDDKGYTFTLREGVKSSAGNELTSEDVVWTYKRNVGLKATGAFVLSAIGVVTDVKAEGKYKVRFETSGPSPMMPFTVLQSYLRILDSTEVKKHVTKDDPWASKWLTSNTAGFGAYDVTAFEPDKSVTMTPSASYWGEKAKREIRYLAISDASSRYSALEKGDVNVAYGLSPQQVKQADTAGLNVFRFKGNSIVSIFPNLKEEQLAKPEVRQALQYATPQDEIVKSVYLGYGHASKSIVPDYFPGYTDRAWNYTYDPAKAKELIAQAGYPDGISTELYYSSESPTLASLATILQGSWEQAGIKVKLVPQPSSTLVTRAFADRDLPLYMTDTSSVVIPDISSAGALWASGGFGNINHYADADFDAAYKSSLGSLDFETRKPFFETMQSAAVKNPIFTAVAGLESIAVASPNVTGYQWEPSQGSTYKTLGTSETE